MIIENKIMFYSFGAQTNNPTTNIFRGSAGNVTSPFGSSPFDLSLKAFSTKKNFLVLFLIIKIHILLVFHIDPFIFNNLERLHFLPL